MSKNNSFGPSLSEIKALASQPAKNLSAEEVERLRQEVKQIGKTPLDDFVNMELAAIESRARMRKEQKYVVDLADTIPEPVPVVTIDQQVVCSRGNISAVVGEPKCKKTFLCTAIVGGLLSAAGYMGVDARDIKILWADTEQSESHVQKVAWRTHAIACLDCTTNDEHLMMLKLRELDPKKRFNVIIEKIFEFNPDLVVIDGVADLQLNTNDLAESEEIVGKLMKLSSARNMHILSVLHTNLHSDKARGHVGSSLLRKSESVIYVRRVGDVSIVEPQYCRNEPFEKFAFRIGRHELPELCDMPQERSGEDCCVSVLREHFGGVAERELLTVKLSETMGVSINAARIRISRAIKRGILQLQPEANTLTAA